MNQMMQPKKYQKMMTKPVNLVFRLFHTKSKVQVWLFEQADLKFEGKIIGFDEYMNLVLDECDEINVKKNTKTNVGKIMLKGDNITLIRPVESNFTNY